MSAGPTMWLLIDNSSDLAADTPFSEHYLLFDDPDAVRQAALDRGWSDSGGLLEPAKLAVGAMRRHFAPPRDVSIFRLEPHLALAHQRERDDNNWKAFEEGRVQWHDLTFDQLRAQLRAQIAALTIALNSARVMLDLPLDGDVCVGIAKLLDQYDAAVKERDAAVLRVAARAGIGQ